MRSKLLILLFSFTIMVSCKKEQKEPANKFYPTTKPNTRWWWFATEIKKEDVKHQLEWAKKMNFGGVEIAWVYPLHRYQKLYQGLNNRYYQIDTSAADWLSKEWSEAVEYTKHCADSLGLACDFTFGSAWPVAGHNIGKEHTTQVYGDTSFRQWLTFAWSYPQNQLVINHLDQEAFEKFAEPIGAALNDALKGSKSALFTDSWEIKLNDKYKIWTPGFDSVFLERFGYDIIPYMEEGIDSTPDVRYDYMLLLEEMVIEGFYKPYVEKCKELGAWSRVQCLASPTDIMTTYAMVDIPETEAMLNNPNFSRIVSSSACLASKPVVSCETFTCMYGFPSTYLRKEQTADLKLVADALFAQGVNQHVYHGMPYNPIGSDTLEFFATTYFGPGGSLTPELPMFNKYMENVSGLMQKGQPYSDVAVYLPYEDGVMQGAYPPERRRVWVWGEYELRYVNMPEELEGHQPLWINRHFLEEGKMENGKFKVGNTIFNALYIDVKYMDVRALKRLHQLAKNGLPICLKSKLTQPGKEKSNQYSVLLDEILAMPNVKSNWQETMPVKPLIETDTTPAFWCREDEAGNHYLFIAQRMSKNVLYPIYSGQSMMKSADTLNVTFNVNEHSIEKTLIFDPYQSLMLKISPTGKIEELDISFVPKDPIVRPREKQRMNF